jgi:hypothetical protein
MALENETIEGEEVEVEDRRSAIEAAFDAQEQQDESAAPVTPEVETQPEAEAKPEVKTEEEQAAPAEKPINVDKAPQSWKPAQRAKWDKLDPDIRQEVLRRDREITKTLGETAQARQLATHMEQLLTPYAARFQELEAHPLAAIDALLKADKMLSSAPPRDRAQYMAKLIKDYKVDIVELDSALSDQVQADPQQSRLEQLLAERLAPIQQFVQQQAAQQQMLEQQEIQNGKQTIEQMEANEAKYPYFADVREDMADLIEIQSKRGVYLSLDQAYSRAIAMNPDVSGLVATQRQEAQGRQAALAANARAQRALKASKSVSGAPTLGTVGSASSSDRRATIEAAFDALSGR